MVIGVCRDTGGGWSDSFVAHTAQVRPIPQTLDTDQAVLIPEFHASLTAVLQHPSQEGDRVLIIGASSLGLLVLQAFKMLKLRREILVIAEHPFEADAARKLSAAQVVLSDDHGACYRQLRNSPRVRCGTTRMEV